MIASAIAPVDVDTAVGFIQAIHNHERAGFAILMYKRGDLPPTHYGLDLRNPRWDALRRVFTRHADADCYVGVAVYAAPPQPGRNRTKAMVLHCRWLICEADEHALPDDLPPPTFVVETSDGRHQIWWRMDRPLTVAEFEDYAERIAAHVGCNVIKDATRVLRLPGMRNHKPGRNGFVVRVVSHDPGAVYTLAAFGHLARTAHAIPKDRRPNQSAPPVGPILAPGVRRTALLSLAGTVRRRGCDREEILALISAINTRRCQPPLADDELDRIAASICRYTPHDVPWQPRQTSPQGHGSSGWTVGATRRFAVGKEDDNG
jgi:hypothetical protein